MGVVYRDIIYMSFTAVDNWFKSYHLSKYISYIEIVIGENICWGILSANRSLKKMWPLKDICHTFVKHILYSYL